MSRSRSVTSVELSMSRPGRGAMNTTPIMRTVAAMYDLPALWQPAACRSHPRAAVAKRTGADRRAQGRGTRAD